MVIPSDSADAGFQNFVTENGFNNRFAVRNDRFAKTPSVFRSSPKF